MSIAAYKRLTIALGVLSLGLLVLCGGLVWNHGLLTVRVAWAEEQTKIFDEMRTQALARDPAGAVRCLASVVGYYPSGSKQQAGSRLDRMVERERARVARDIVAYLRAKTGADLGDSPEAWIQRYDQP